LESGMVPGGGVVEVGGGKLGGGRGGDCKGKAKEAVDRELGVAPWDSKTLLFAGEDRVPALGMCWPGESWKGKLDMEAVVDENLVGS